MGTDALVGFDTAGAMCIRANRAPSDWSKQLTGQSVLIPQAGDVLLLNGQLDSLRTTPSTAPAIYKLQKRLLPPQPEVSQLATAEEARKKAPDANRTRSPACRYAPAEEPVYQVFVPPLIYDANAKVQPEVDPKMIVLVRRVRVRPRSFSEAAWKAWPLLPLRRPRRPRPHRPMRRMLRSRRSLQ